MSPGVALDAAVLFLAAAFALSGLVALLPGPRGDLARREAEARDRLFFPAMGAFAAVALGFASARWEAWRRWPDHCGECATHPPFLCWLHPDRAWTLHPTEALAGVLVLVLAALATRLLIDAARGRAGVRRLEGLADPDRSRELARLLDEAGRPWHGPVAVVRSDAPLCATAGVLRRRLLLSTAIVEVMPRAELLAIVAHEAAHARRRDAGTRIAGRLAALAHLPGLGRPAFRAWVAAGEASCDAASASLDGSPLPLAGALLRFERLLRAQPAPRAGVGLGDGGGLAARVHLLLEPPLPTPALGLLGRWPWLVLLALLARVDLLHATLEALLRFLHR